MFKVGQLVRDTKHPFRMHISEIRPADALGKRYKGGLMLISPEGITLRWKQGDTHIQVLEEPAASMDEILSMLADAGVKLETAEDITAAVVQMWITSDADV
jgi:hypothetical protein